ncbi:TonB dependent receptor [Sphingomonas carotinifaciens]|uniref:TonB dependent receptor n=2 Tax=Sphingomonas carotinifaciens TaxID=1166323 RepID=A0A1G7L3G9_9SPHN|nr:TonB dependent receptor [Sphingomonas carotinifaciens]
MWGKGFEMVLKQSVSIMALAGSLVLSAVPALAQQASNTDPATTDAVEQSAETRAAAIGGQQAAAPQEDGEGQTLVVTGTRIQRPNVASAAPITSVTTQDIKAQAPLNVEEVLNRLPQVAPDSQQNYQDSDGRQRIKLRSLGFERTLVLIDGKRLGTQNGQDTGIIPPSLLERIDVLSGGASSVYGSDAVAGVVNFILRPSFEGVRLDANYSFYNHNNRDTLVSPIARNNSFTSPRGLTNDGGRSDITLTAGKKLFGDALSLMGFVNYRQADVVDYSARSSSPCQLVENGKDGPLSCTLSTYSPSGYIQPAGTVNNGAQLVNNPNGTRTFVPYGAGPGNAANPYDGYSYQRQLERWNAGGFATLQLGSDTELYGSAIWFRDKSYNRYPNRILSYTAYGTTPYQVNCDNPFLSGAQATTLCGAQAGSATATAPLDVRYRFNDLPYVLDEYVNKGIRATAGIRGKVGDAWTYDVGGVYARNQQTITAGDIPDYTRVNRALDVVSVNGTPTCRSVVNGTDPSCVPLDAFRAGVPGAAVMNYLLTGDLQSQGSVGELWDVVTSVTGDLGKYGVTSPFAEDGLAIALGAEYRKDSFRGYANDLYRQLNGGEDFSTSQDVWESNIEVQAPLVQRKPFAHLLQVNGGFRVSKYSSNPQTFNTWKAEALWAPVSDLTFRASFNKAQRAPTVIEIRQAQNISYGTQGGSQNDFCAPTRTTDPATGQVVYGTPIASREVCRATGLSDALYGSTSLICPNDQCTTRSGGFVADPETAYTQTYGLVVKPSFIRGLIFSVDRYRIKINDSLGYNDYSYYTDGCLRSGGDPFFCSGIVRNAAGNLFSPGATNPTSGFIRQGTTNYYQSIARGWDFQSQYTLNAGGAGRFDFNFNGSLTTFAGGQDSPIQPQRNCVGYYGNGCGQLLPKWSHNFRTTWSTPDNVFNASFNWRYVGSLTSANNSGDEAIGGTPERARATFYRIDPQSYFDLALTFNIARQFAFRIIANNLFDKVPPILPNSYDIALARNNTIPARYDSLGRQIAIGTTINF